MSVSLYRWTPACEGVPCPGDCDLCSREEEEINDLISRQAAIDICNDELLHTEDYSPIRTWGRILDLPSAQPEPQWIPCSERLPEPDEEYLVTVRERWRDKEWTNHVDMAWLNSDPAAGYIGGWETWNDWREGQEVEIIAWMPLPKPYDDFSEHMNEPEEE